MRSAGLILLAFLFQSQSFAFSWRPPKTSSSSGPYTSYQDPNYNYSYKARSDISGAPNDLMANLARSASDGAGNLSKKGSLCYRSVKQIVADALGKNLGCIRGILSSVAAKNAGRDLLRLGFREDSSQCKTAGAIRVYKGIRFKGTRALAGDIYGHVEVVGDDNRYHSFYSSPISMDDSMPGRRILTGCYVPDSAKIAKGPASRCSSAKHSGPSYKKRKGGR